MKRYHIVDTTADPVVTTYMDCIGRACADGGGVYDHIAYRSMPPREDVLIHDSVLSAVYYMLRGYRNGIVWIQGVLPEESYMRNRSRLRTAVLSGIERYVLKRADYVLFVSDEMKRHYEEKYGLSFAGRCFVMPCFNELETLPEAFADGGKYSRNTMLYVGSLNRWQCFEETAALVKKVQERMGEDIPFHVFTRDRDEAQSVLELHGVRQYRVDFAAAEELKHRIAAYKYGFVLRKDHVVNRVATPTKFSNYISCGIIPIYSSCLKSFAAADAEIGLGVVADPDDMDAAAEKIAAHMRSRVEPEEIREKCGRYFSGYYHAPRYIAEMGGEIRKIVWRK